MVKISQEKLVYVYHIQRTKMLNKIGLEITVCLDYFGLHNVFIVSSAYSFNIKAFQEYGVSIFFAYCIWRYGNNIPTLFYISLPYYFEEYVPVQAVFCDELGQKGENLDD